MGKLIYYSSSCYTSAMMKLGLGKISAFLETILPGWGFSNIEKKF